MDQKTVVGSLLNEKLEIDQNAFGRHFLFTISTKIHWAVNFSEYLDNPPKSTAKSFLVSKFDQIPLGSHFYCKSGLLTRIHLERCFLQNLVFDQNPAGGSFSVNKIDQNPLASHYK